MPKTETNFDHTLAYNINDAKPYPDIVQEDLQEERHGDGEDGAAGGDEPIGEAEVPLEVVADDGEGRRVGEGGARPEQHAVRQIQRYNLRGEKAGFGTSSDHLQMDR